MQQARVIIALVGPGWHISSDKKAEDWVRKELATAVQGAKPILPVLVGESEVLRPKLASMPEAFRRQAVVVGPDRTDSRSWLPNPLAVSMFIGGLLQGIIPRPRTSTQ